MSANKDYTRWPVARTSSEDIGAMSAANISKLPPFDPGSDAVNVIVETPRGCRTKFKYDDKSGLFRFDKMMPTGLTFPFDFGFLPSTRGEDGDPLDVLILTEEPAFPGCLILGALAWNFRGRTKRQGENHAK
jgi:inorganic pyrophosphatase